MRKRSPVRQLVRRSANAFDRLREAGLATCSVCGSASVEKAVMAPKVMGTKAETPSSSTAEPDTDERPLSAPATAFEKKIMELRQYVETHAEDVGTRFAEEARAIHDGDAARALDLRQGAPRRRQVAGRRRNSRCPPALAPRTGQLIDQTFVMFPLTGRPRLTARRTVAVARTARVDNASPIRSSKLVEATGRTQPSTHVTPPSHWTDSCPAW